MLNRYC